MSAHGRDERNPAPECARAECARLHFMSAHRVSAHGGDRVRALPCARTLARIAR